MFPGFPTYDSADIGLGDPKLPSKGGLCVAFAAAPSYVKNLGFGELRAVVVFARVIAQAIRNGMGCVLARSDVLQVACAVVELVAINVVDLLPFGDGTQERAGYQLMHAMFGSASFSGEVDAAVTIVGNAADQGAASEPSAINSSPVDRSDPAAFADLVMSFVSNDGAPFHSRVCCLCSNKLASI